MTITRRRFVTIAAGLTLATALSPAGTSRTNPVAVGLSLTPGRGFDSAQLPGALTVTVPPGKGFMSSNAGGWMPAGNSTVNSFFPTRRAAEKSAARPCSL